MTTMRNSGVPERRDQKSKARIRLDEVDIKILQQLVLDSRISQRALARAIGMSAPAVADRITRLEKAGVISGYHTQLNWAALGRPMTVVVDVISDRSNIQLDLAESLAGIAEVERIDLLTGSRDLQIRLHVRDQDHLNEVLFNRLWSADEIRRTETQLALVTVEPAEFSERVLQSLLDEMTAVDDPD